MSAIVRKPILLLVDDDPSVLAALESELREALVELVRVEAVDRPEEALAAAKHWSDEGRVIAVAIVDQKMPGLTGVELIKAQRGHSAGASMRAVLLTGYASLENAVAAKNEAGVDRFLEKPWLRDSLTRAARRLLAVHLTETGADAFLHFREARTPREIREQLHIRYEIYRATPALAHYFPENEPELAVDAFDRGARYGALSLVTGEGEEALGTVRIVSTDDGWGASAVVDVLEASSELRERALAPRPALLPLLTFWPARERITRFLAEFAGAGEGAVEIGRLALRPQARGAAGGAVAAAMLLVEGMAAFAGEVLGVENVLLTCNAAHARFYTSLGMRPAAGGDREYVENNREWLMCLHARREWVPPAAQDRIDALALRLEQRGASCRCANFTNCLSGPYRTGQFADSELFCPERARTLLQPSADGSGRP